MCDRCNQNFPLRLCHCCFTPKPVNDDFVVVRPSIVQIECAKEEAKAVWFGWILSMLYCKLLSTFRQLFSGFCHLFQPDWFGFFSQMTFLVCEWYEQHIKLNSYKWKCGYCVFYSCFEFVFYFYFFFFIQFFSCFFPYVVCVA